jgi:hypothetical protein
MGIKFLALGVATSVSALESEDRLKFIQFVAKYGKSYVSVDHHEERFTVFSENLRFVDENNSKELGFRMGVNQFSDQRLQEIPMWTDGTVPL